MEYTKSQLLKFKEALLLDYPHLDPALIDWIMHLYEQGQGPISAFAAPEDGGAFSSEEKATTNSTDVSGSEASGPGSSEPSGPEA
jgi:hypothetical protein